MSEEEPDSILLPYLQTEIAVAIANAISAWAYFEQGIDELIWALASLEPTQGACLTSQYQTVATRFEALTAIARVQKIPTKHIKRLNALKARSLALAQARNRLVHDPWFFGYTTGAHYRLQRTARSILDFGYKEVSASDISKFENDIKTLTAAFYETQKDIMAAFYSSP